jgi:hypothetical protein
MSELIITSDARQLVSTRLACMNSVVSVFSLLYGRLAKSSIEQALPLAETAAGSAEGGSDHWAWARIRSGHECEASAGPVCHWPMPGSGPRRRAGQNAAAGKDGGGHDGP